MNNFSLFLLSVISTANIFSMDKELQEALRRSQEEFDIAQAIALSQQPRLTTKFFGRTLIDLSIGEKISPELIQQMRVFYRDPRNSIPKDWIDDFEKYVRPASYEAAQLERPLDAAADLESPILSLNFKVLKKLGCIPPDFPDTLPANSLVSHLQNFNVRMDPNTNIIKPSGFHQLNVTETILKDCGMMGGLKCSELVSHQGQRLQDVLILTPREKLTKEVTGGLVLTPHGYIRKHFFPSHWSKLQIVDFLQNLINQENCQIDADKATDKFLPVFVKGNYQGTPFSYRLIFKKLNQFVIGPDSIPRLEKDKWVLLTAELQKNPEVPQQAQDWIQEKGKVRGKKVFQGIDTRKESLINELLHSTFKPLTGQGRPNQFGLDSIKNAEKLFRGFIQNGNPLASLIASNIPVISVIKILSETSLSLLQPKLLIPILNIITSKAIGNPELEAKIQELKRDWASRLGEALDDNIELLSLFVDS